MKVSEKSSNSEEFLPTFQYGKIIGENYSEILHFFSIQIAPRFNLAK